MVWSFPFSFMPRRVNVAVPDFQSFFLPLLKFAKDGQTHTTKEAYAAMAEHFKLSGEDLKEMLPSGKQVTYKNRIAWARVYLTKALLLESPKRGSFQITERGKELLTQNPENLRVKQLKQYSEFVDFHKSGSKQGINGNRLVDLMIDHNMGVSTVDIYEIKKIFN